MGNVLLCEVEISGCMSADLIYIEVLDAGSDEANAAAAEVRYAEINGRPFESYYCEQCFDSTWMSTTPLSQKHSRKVLARAAVGRTNRNGQPFAIHRLNEARVA